MLRNWRQVDVIANLIFGLFLFLFLFFRYVFVKRKVSKTLMYLFLERRFPREDTRKGALSKKRALAEGKSFA